jgi:hypothetical protein
MRRTWLAGMLGALLVGALPTGVVLVATDRSANDHLSVDAQAHVIARASESATPGQADDDGDGDGDGDGKHDGKQDRKQDRKQDKGGGGLGPPPWAHSHGRHEHGAGHGAGAAWKDAWRELTPPQRARKMAAFAKAHAAGMQKWADCITAAGNDSAKRAACKKPLPPGQAKRQP